jgi:hypothetical protein
MRNRHTARLRKKEEIFSYNADYGAKERRRCFIGVASVLRGVFTIDVMLCNGKKRAEGTQLIVYL